MRYPRIVRALHAAVWIAPVVVVVILVLESQRSGLTVFVVGLGLVVALTVGWHLGAGIPKSGASPVELFIPWPRQSADSPQTRDEPSSDHATGTGTTLAGADLSGADLTGADLTGADLHGLDLRDVNLTRAVLREANLRGALLSGGEGSDADRAAGHERLRDR
jgi:hypothetical protein